MDFCYGSCDGMLWPVLDAIFCLSLRFDNSREAVEERKKFLCHEKLGICDIVASCKRKKIDASDLGMRNIELRDILKQLVFHPTIETLLFMGGNSKNGPEYLFRRQLRSHGLKLERIGHDLPKKHTFRYDNRKITAISLTSPSNAANRAVGGTPLYKQRKNENPAYTTFDFRVEQYREFFYGEKTSLFQATLKKPAS